MRSHYWSFVLVFQSWFLAVMICLSLAIGGPYSTAGSTSAAAASAAFASHQTMRANTQSLQTLQSSHYYVKPTGTTTTTTTTTALCMSQIPSPSAGSSTGSTAGTATEITTKKRRPPRPVFLTHERDFFRQEARLNSMDSYVLVSTLTASMSFGCLVGFNPHPAAEVAAAVTNLLGMSAGSTSSAAATAATATTTTATILTTIQWLYKALCLAIQIVSGLSSLCGLYATIIFSLTILYGKSALGAERDREYDKFLRRTVRARVHGARCFSWSLGLFAVEALLVLMERTSRHVFSLPIGCVGAFILYHLYKDWKLLFESTEVIYKD